MPYILHSGVQTRSGRYSWGSGERPFQRLEPWGNVASLKAQGVSERDIAIQLGYLKDDGSPNISAVKKAYANYVSAERAEKIHQVVKLRDKGMSNTAIAQRLGITEGTVRNYLDEGYQTKSLMLERTKDFLREAVAANKYIDVGGGNQWQMGITKTKLDTAISGLVDEGYELKYLTVNQAGTGLPTSLKVLVPPGTSWSEVNAHKDEIVPAMGFTQDGGLTYHKIEPPRSVDSSRVEIRYAEQGGTDRDGVIELRRGVEDLSLGKANYAQVRIAVDDTHYLKGMAVYADDLPDGIDIRFNTNKHEGTPMLGPKDNTVLKPMKDDPENRFGASIITDQDKLNLFQRYYTDSNGKEQLSCINVVTEEGKWGEWSRNLSAQFLSKQTPLLAKQQLDLEYNVHKSDYDDIMSISNPVIKAHFLKEFADECDSDAVHLKGAGLPGQRTHVLLPLPSLGEKEAYAPRYENGEKLILIRYPHAGIFEIPMLTVNNRNKEGLSIMGTEASDAIGLHPKSFAQLSGADSDGDTAMVIPLRGNLSSMVKWDNAREELINFDPKASYPKYEGMKVISGNMKQRQMGIVSNLITDMTIKKAPIEDIVKAVKHSMVVIDAEKHELNWKQSEKDNDIAALKKLYQMDPETGKAGSATLISRSKSPLTVNQRQNYYNIDPETGAKIFKETGKTYTTYKLKTMIDGKLRTLNGTWNNLVKKKGVDPEELKTAERTVHLRTQGTTRSYELEDVSSLSSGTQIERIYVSFANRLKALGNQARKSFLSADSEDYYYQSSAEKTYAKEVESLKSKLAIAEANAPLERKAQALAEKKIRALYDDESMDKDKLKKEKNRALQTARERVGAKKQQIVIEDREWEAIQHGAVRKTLLKNIIKHTDSDRLRDLATPKTKIGISSAKLSLARQLLNRDYTLAEVAQQIGVSVSTLETAIK